MSMPVMSAPAAKSRRSAPGGAVFKAMFGGISKSAAPAPQRESMVAPPPPPPPGGGPPSAAPVRMAAPAAPPMPAQMQQKQQQQAAPQVQQVEKKPDTSKPVERLVGVEESSAGEGVADVPDYTKLPAQLDKRLEELDTSNAVRPTIIAAGETWTKKAMASLMSKAPTTTILEEEGLREEKSKAFELLDALTRSGALIVEEAALHVVIGATHTFDKGLVDTVVQDNVNPVVQVERSSLIMASSIMQTPAAQLIKGEHLERVKALTPALFPVEALMDLQN